MTDERRYLAFLVRVWSVHPNGKLIWRASAENVHTNERHAFADLTALFDFLRTAVEEEPPAPGPMEGGHEEL
jgi:hypothetical protein